MSRSGSRNGKVLINTPSRHTVTLGLLYFIRLEDMIAITCLSNCWYNYVINACSHAYLRRRHWRHDDSTNRRHARWYFAGHSIYRSSCIWSEKPKCTAWRGGHSGRAAFKKDRTKERRGGRGGREIKQYFLPQLTRFVLFLINVTRL